MVTVHSFGAPPAAKPPQVWIAMPMPCLTVRPGPLPGGCHLSFHPESLSGDVELLVVDRVAAAPAHDDGVRRLRVVRRQVLAADHQRVDAELGREVVDGELGQHAVLRVAGGTHGSRPAGVGERDRVATASSSGSRRR